MPTLKENQCCEIIGDGGNIGGGGGGTPGGADTNVQFNDSGSFGGSSDFTWDGSSLSVPAIGDLDTLAIGASAPPANVCLYALKTTGVTVARLENTNSTNGVLQLQLLNDSSKELSIGKLSSTYAVGTFGAGSGAVLNRDGNMNIICDSNDPIIFYTDVTDAQNLSATEKMRLTAAGDLGIGTNSPSARIDLSDGGIICDNAASGYNVKDSGGTAKQVLWASAADRLYLGAFSGLELRFRLGDSTDSCAIFNSSNGFDFNTQADSAYDFRYRSSSLTALIYGDSSANTLGIGTDSPSVTHLVHAQYASPGTDSGFYIENTGSGSASIRMKSNGQQWNLSMRNDSIQFIDDRAWFTDADIRLWLGNRSAHASGINTNGTPTAEWHVRQDGTTAATPVLKLEQLDQDYAFTDYVGTSGSGNSIDSRTTSGATSGHVKIKINGTDAWIAYSTTAPS